MFWILIVGFALRVWHLEIKPIHFDEGINGHFVGTIWRDGFYRYDPTNFHGPLYFYFLAFAEMIFGRSVEALRTVTVLFGSLLTFIPFLYRRWIGTRAAWIAAEGFQVVPIERRRHQDWLRSFGKAVSICAIARSRASRSTSSMRAMPRVASTRSSRWICPRAKAIAYGTRMNVTIA